MNFVAVAFGFVVWLGDETDLQKRFLDSINLLRSDRVDIRSLNVNAESVVWSSRNPSGKEFKLNILVECSEKEKRYELKCDDKSNAGFNYVAIDDGSGTIIRYPTSVDSSSVPKGLVISRDAERNQKRQFYNPFDLRFIGVTTASILSLQEKKVGEFLAPPQNGISIKLASHDAKEAIEAIWKQGETTYRCVVVPDLGNNIVACESICMEQTRKSMSSIRFWEDGKFWFPERVVTEEWDGGKLTSKSSTTISSVVVDRGIDRNRFTLGSMNLPEMLPVFEFGTDRQTHELFWDGKKIIDYTTNPPSVNMNSVPLEQGGYRWNLIVTNVGVIILLIAYILYRTAVRHSKDRGI